MYVIMSSAMYERYYNEPEKYSNMIKIYDAVDSQFELVKEFIPQKNNGSVLCMKSIFHGIEYIIDTIEKDMLVMKLKYIKLNHKKLYQNGLILKLISKFKFLLSKWSLGKASRLVFY